MFGIFEHIQITTDGKLPEQICTDCLCDLEVAFRFRKNCERSDEILQRCLNPTEDTLNDEYIEQSDDGDIIVSTTSLASRASKDSRVVVSSDCGLYEYRPPIGLNVKLVKNDTSPRVVRTMTRTRKLASGDGGGGGDATTTATTSPSEHTIYLKSEPMNDEDSLDENDGIELLYEDVDSNFDDSSDADRTLGAVRKVGLKSGIDVTATNDQNSKLMPIKPVRTNKIRLGYTSSNKSKNSTSATTTTAKTATTTTAALSMATSAAIAKAKENGSKENATTNRSPKNKTNAKGEPKLPKTCEICGNTYTYQHALER